MLELRTLSIMEKEMSSKYTSKYLKFSSCFIPKLPLPLYHRNPRSLVSEGTTIPCWAEALIHISVCGPYMHMQCIHMCILYAHMYTFLYRLNILIVFFRVLLCICVVRERKVYVPNSRTHHLFLHTFGSIWRIYQKSRPSIRS